jgi:hypothetical protein
MSRVERVRTPVGCFALLVAATAVIFFPVWDPGQHDLAGMFDVYRYFVPANYFFDASLHAGDFPTWNPLILSGMPHAADPQVWAFYPPNLVRALLNIDPDPLSTATGLTVLMALHLLWLGSGTFVLARRHGLSRAASALATIGVVFSAMVVRRAAAFHFIFTLAWLPWILVLLGRIVETREMRGKCRLAVVLGPTLGLAVLGGSPQILPQIAAVALAYAVAILPRPGSVSPPEWLRVAWRTLLPALIAGGIAAGIAACSVLPAWQLLELSGRAAGADAVSGHAPEAWSWSYVWQSLAVYPGRILEPQAVRGAGVALLALAITGLLVRPRAALPFVAMLYVLVDLLLGLPLSVLARLLVPFEMVSATRAFNVAVLPLAMLAGYGLDALRDGRRFRRAIPAAVAALAGLLSLWTLATCLDAGIWLEPPREVVYAPALAVAVAVAAAFVPRGRAVLLALVPLLVFVELWGWNRVFLTRLTIRSGHDAQLDEYLADRSGVLWSDNRRGTIYTYNYNLYRLEPAINGYNPLHIERVRQVLAGHVRGKKYRRAVREKEIPVNNARGHQFMKRAFWLVDTAVPGPLPPSEQLFAPSRYAFLPDGVPEGFPTLPPDRVPIRPVSDSSRVLPLPPPVLLGTGSDPRGFLTARHGAGPVELPPQHAALELAYRATTGARLSSHFELPDAARLAPGLRVKLRESDDGDRTVHIPLPDATSLRIVLETLSHHGDPRPEITRMHIVSDDADEDESIEVVSRSADRVEVAVRALPAPRLLVFLDADYPGWHAEVDGEPVPIHRAQDAFKSVVVPAGDHTIEFRFSSTPVHVGVGLTLFTWIGASVAWLTLGRASTANPPDHGGESQAACGSPETRSTTPTGSC